MSTCTSVLPHAQGALLQKESKSVIPDEGLSPVPTGRYVAHISGRRSEAGAWSEAEMTTVAPPNPAGQFCPTCQWRVVSTSFKHVGDSQRQEVSQPTAKLEMAELRQNLMGEGREEEGSWDWRCMGEMSLLFVGGQASSQASP